MISIFLAKVLGVYLVVFSIAAFTNRKQLISMISNIEEDSFQVYFSGTIIFILGLLIVNSHNIWTMDYRGVITFLGWLTIFKGAVRIFWGQKVVSMGKNIFNSRWYNIILGTTFLVGVWFTLIGYGIL